MVLPKLTEEQRVESFVETRLLNFDKQIMFSKKGLAEFCLKEFDYAICMINSTNIKDVEEQLEEN